MPFLTEEQLLAAKPFKHQILAKLRDGREPFVSSRYHQRGERFHWGEDEVYPRDGESAAGGWESDGRVAVPQGTPVFAPCDGYLQDIDHPWQNKSGGHIWLNVFTKPCPPDLLSQRTDFGGWDDALNPWSGEAATGWKLGVWHLRMVLVRDFQVVRAGQFLGFAGFDPRNNPGSTDLIHTHKELRKLGTGQNGSVNPRQHFEGLPVLPWTPVWPGMVHTMNGPLDPPWGVGTGPDSGALERYALQLEEIAAQMRLKP